MDTCEKTADIEITPEMLKAGMGEFLDYNSDFSDDSETVESIFRAMWNAMAATENGRNLARLGPQ